MLFHYTIYGLTVCSTQPLPILRPAPPPVTDVVCVSVDMLGQTGHARVEQMQPVPSKDTAWKEWSPTSVDEVREGDTIYLWVRFSGGIEFLIDRAGTEVCGWYPESVTLESATLYLIGPVLGTVLRLRGTTLLHACAINVNGSAIAMLGDAGAGKSSLATTFARLNYAILTDDLVAIKEHRGSLMVQSGHPWIFVPPETVEALYGYEDALPQAVPPWPKKRLDLIGNGLRFQSEPLPLRGVYLIGQRSQSPRAPFVRRVPPRRALLALLTNSHAARRVQVGRPERDFDVLTRIVAGMPVRRVTPLADRKALPGLCQTIVDDFNQHTSQSA